MTAALTGYADRALLDEISGSRTIGKPFDARELAETLAHALSKVEQPVVQRAGWGARTAV